MRLCITGANAPLAKDLQPHLVDENYWPGLPSDALDAPTFIPAGSHWQALREDGTPFSVSSTIIVDRRLV